MRQEVEYDSTRKATFQQPGMRMVVLHGCWCARTACWQSLSSSRRLLVLEFIVSGNGLSQRRGEMMPPRDDEPDDKQRQYEIQGGSEMQATKIGYLGGSLYASFFL